MVEIIIQTLQIYIFGLCNDILFLVDYDEDYEYYGIPLENLRKNFAFQKPQTLNYIDNI
jgi:hypothetical protein